MRIKQAYNVLSGSNSKVLLTMMLTLILTGLFGCGFESTNPSLPTVMPDASVPLPTIVPTVVVPDTSAPTPMLPAQAQDSEGAKPSEPPTETGITSEEAIQLIPLNPSEVAVEIEDSVVVLTWMGTGEDISGYAVYRKPIDTEAWQELMIVEVAKENTEQYEFRDTTGTPGNTYVYGVASIDTYGNMSPISKSTSITMK